MQGARTTLTINGTEWSIPLNPLLEDCKICFNDLAITRVCDSEHRYCLGCYDKFETGECPECKKELIDRKAALSSQRNYLNALEKTTFFCLTQNCQWEGSFKQLEIHKKLCLETKERCSFGCGEHLFRYQIKHHQTECRKRPYKEGNLVTDYETVLEVKQLKSECQDALKKTSLEQGSKNHLYERLVRIFPLVADAALEEHEPVTQPTGTVYQKECAYKCGFIASSIKEISSHICPNVPLTCRHCKNHVLPKEIGGHESICDERVVSCRLCGVDTKQVLLALHFQSCIKHPEECPQCQCMVVRQELEQHKQTQCLSRLIDCERCFTSVVFSELEAHKQGCWLTKPVTLREGKPDAILLTPQPDSVGPFYQNGNNSSVIYMVTTHDQLKSLPKQHHKHVFPRDLVLRCTYDGEPATMQESFTIWGEKRWMLCLRQRYPNNFITSRADVLDADSNIICSFYRNWYPKITDIEINANDRDKDTAALHKDEISRLEHYSHPSHLRIIRFMKK
ncbi:hypothetical protein [Parendozoicomonas haliclonae]|uniref:TRAF-type zinc finger n=1 Tax=Parendozoicomonas haliclonae TaxID=1960125 RepID=A0A1X7AJI2_9GAMM|nr:hypothetical protein [Parendozoicomonas haliclonae]SMA46013.1 hypothetical protein EHSB41UT_02061 [Parendozoicomonas haliclonae]